MRAIRALQYHRTDALSMKLCLRLALLLLCLGQTGILLAATCASVFPSATSANSSSALNLSGVAWQNSPAIGNSDRSLGAGDHYFAGGVTSNGWSLTTTGGPTTRVFVNGNLSLGNSSTLNAGGNPQDLLFIVNGSLALGNNVQINGFVYVTGSIQHGNNLLLNGAITSLGAATSPGGNTVLSYAGDALSLAQFGSLCEGNSPPLLNWSLDQSTWTGAADEVLDSSGNNLHGTVFNGAATSKQAPALPSVNGQGTCG